jgi:hypothetical protein
MTIELLLDGLWEATAFFSAGPDSNEPSLDGLPRTLLSSPLSSAGEALRFDGILETRSAVTSDTENPRRLRFFCTFELQLLGL